MTLNQILNLNLNFEILLTEKLSTTFQEEFKPLVDNLGKTAETMKFCCFKDQAII